MRRDGIQARLDLTRHDETWWDDSQMKMMTTMMKYKWARQQSTDATIWCFTGCTRGWLSEQFVSNVSMSLRLMAWSIANNSCTSKGDFEVFMAGIIIITPCLIHLLYSTRSLGTLDTNTHSTLSLWTHRLDVAGWLQGTKVTKWGDTIRTTWCLPVTTWTFITLWLPFVYIFLFTFSFFPQLTDAMRFCTLHVVWEIK